MESAAGAVLSFQGMTNYLGWERVGGDFRPLLWGLGGHGAHRLSPTGL